MDMTKTLEATSADAELKVLDDAELDAVNGGLLNRSFVGLINVGVANGNQANSLSLLQFGGANVGGVGQNTGNIG